jgi:6-phosphogluconolactonase (cycloisomerase 2 family)
MFPPQSAPGSTSREQGRIASPWIAIPIMMCAVLALFASVNPARAAVLYSTEANLNRIAVYRIKGNGSLPAKAFQRISTSANPRRLFLTSRALYVATRTRIDAFKIDEFTGRLSRFTDIDGSIIRPANVADANFQYLTVDSLERYLYVSSTAQDRILGYPIAADGSIREIGSCTQGTEATRYQGLAATSSTLYAVGHVPGHVAMFPLRDDGAIQALTEDPDADDSEEDGEDPVDENMLEVFTSCMNPPVSFPPTSTKSFSNPKVLLLSPSASLLYTTDIFEDRVYACTIAADGSLPDCPRQKKSKGVTRTESGGQYEQLVLSDDAVLYASIFQTGNLRAFILRDDGGVPKRHEGKHPSDLFTAPGGVAIWCDAVLYTGQGDADRIDAFRINKQGFVGNKKKLKAFSRTKRVSKAFPNALAVLLLDGEGCD